MPKSGTKDWYKAKYEETVEELEAANRVIAELEGAQSGAALDLSLLDERNKAAISKFFSRADRYTKTPEGQLVGACMAYLANGTRAIPVAALIAQLKRMKGVAVL